MSLKVVIKHSYGGIPIVEIEAELNETIQLDSVTTVMNEVYKMVKRWQTVIEKRRQRAIQKTVKPLPLTTMSYAKKLFT